MKTMKSRAAFAGILTISTASLVGLLAGAQRPVERAAATGRFEFEIVESFDAKYLGDTPGHVGKNGGLGDRRPDVAIGDPVYRGEAKIGTISGLTWDRDKGSLQVEFDPEPFQRVGVGEIAWIKLDTTKEASSKEASPKGSTDANPR